MAVSEWPAPTSLEKCPLVCRLLRYSWLLLVLEPLDESSKRRMPHGEPCIWSLTLGGRACFFPPQRRPALERWYDPCAVARSAVDMELMLDLEMSRCVLDAPWQCRHRVSRLLALLWAMVAALQRCWRWLISAILTFPSTRLIERLRR